MYKDFFHHGQSCTHLLTDNKQFWISTISVTITFFAVIVALFRDQILLLLFKPRLIFKTTPSVPQKFKEESYWMYRLLIVNDGSAIARDVRAQVNSVTQPLNLKWTHIDKITREISKKESVYLDVIQEKKSRFYFYPWGDIIDLPEYKLSSTESTKIEIKFFEKNQPLQSVSLELNPINRTLEVL